MAKGIKVVATDLETGEVVSQTILPGSYGLIVADPLYQDGVVQYRNGTIIITLKRDRDAPNAEKGT